MTATPILQAKGLMKRYGTVVAMSGCDFDLMPGEIIAVMWMKELNSITH